MRNTQSACWCIFCTLVGFQCLRTHVYAIKPPTPHTCSTYFTGSRDEAVRELRSCADALAHQLECALADRSLLLQQVSALAGIQRSADAAAALRAAIAAAGLEDDLAAALDGGGSEGNGGGGSVTDEQRAAERLAALEQELQDITAGASEASGA